MLAQPVYAGPFDITSPVMYQTGAVLAIAFALLAIAFIVARVFMIQSWEVWVRQEWMVIIFSAILLVLFVSFASVMESTSKGFAKDVLQTTATEATQAGQRVDILYWTYDSTRGRWNQQTSQQWTANSCTEPCHFYIARAVLGSTYEKYATMLANKPNPSSNTWNGLAPHYADSLLYESFGMGGGLSVRLVVITLAFRFSIPTFAGRAILNNAYETVINVLLQTLGSLKVQEMVLLTFQNLSGILFAAGLVLRIPWFTRKLGGLLVACAIGIYCIYPIVYVLGWYTVDRTTIQLDTSTSAPNPSLTDIASPAGSIERSADVLFTKYPIEGDAGSIGLLDIASRTYIPALMIPTLAIFVTIGFIRHFSPMIGGDTEIAGLTKLI